MEGKASYHYANLTVCASLHRLFESFFILGTLPFFRWTGSNTNPNNNDGQGLPGTDRSNLVMLENQVYTEGSLAYYTPYSKNGHFGRSYPLNLDDTTFLGFSRAELEDMAVLSSRECFHFI